MGRPLRVQLPLSLSVLQAGGGDGQEGCLRSTGDLHAAHSVTEAIGPEAGHILLLNLQGVALEIGSFEQADLVLLGILGKESCIRDRKKEQEQSECT